MNFTKNNESFDDDEAQNLASEWVQRLECSLLARLSEDKNSLEIDSSENCSVAFLDDLQAVNSRNERAEGACLVAAKGEVRPEKFIHAEYVDSGTECARGVFAGTAHSCSSNDEEERHDKAQFPLNKPSPRVNLDLIRQKRLEYFEQVSDVLHKDDATEWKSIRRENSKCNVVRLDAASADHGVSNRHDFRYDSSLDSHEVYENISPRSCGEDDEIRLDLWGLKDAVKSGEIDLKPYINLPCSNKRLVYGPKDSSRTLHKADLATSLACFPNQISNTATLPKHLLCENTRVNETSQSQEQPVMDVEHPNRRSFPEPQISGSLYTCSDMFGSEDSLPGSKSVTSSEVYKRHKRTDLFDDKGNKHTEKRGKETILNELTEFMKTSNQLDTLAFSSVTKSSQHEGAANCLNKGSTLATCSYETSDLYKEPSVRRFQLGSKGDKGDNNTATSYSSDDKLMSATKGNLKAKICPKCHEVNSKAANWCIECGSALITVKSSLLTVKQEKEYEKQCTQTKSLIWETLKSDTAVADTSGMVKSRVSSSKEEHSVKSVEDLSNRLDNSLAFAEGRCSQSGLDYKRRWLRSSIAWSSYDSSELSKPSSLPIEQTPDQALRSTVNKHCSVASLSESTGSQLAKGNSGSYSAQMTQNNNVEWGFNEKENMEQRTSSQVHSSFAVRKELHDVLPTKSIVPPLNLQDVGSYERILTLIRSQRESDPLPYLCLPDELLLHIFSYLSQGMLVTSSLVCRQFYRIAMDNALWQTITIRKKTCLTDGSLESIGKRHPASLTISYCHGETVTSQGLRSLFRQCGDTLEELDFSGCSGGELIGESILLHVAARCPKVKVIDASWSNVSDNGVRALVESVKRLECLCLNGCQAVTDGSLESVANRHGESLRIFEVFGCFNITPAGVHLVGHRCQHLQTLNIGQCHKITDSAIGSVVSGLHELENLDLRGCKQIRDTAVKQIVCHCSLLTSLVLANCPMITDTSLAEIANSLPGIRSLDICGCAKVTDNGIRALSRRCHRLELLDLSSTGVTNKSVTTLANYCSQSLCSLKLSFCTDVSDSSVKVLVKYCKRLTTLHLYGCKLIKDPRALKVLNRNLTIEC